MTFRRAGILFLLLGVALSLNAQLTIGGAPVVIDTAGKSILCSLPETCFSGNYQAKVKYNGSQWQSLIIDGKQVENETLYDFGTIAEGTSFSVDVTTPLQQVHYNLQFTFLPIVTLQGDFGYDYEEGSVSVFMPGQFTPTTFAIKAKWRGAVTNISDRHKRNFHIKLLNSRGQSVDYSFFDLREDNDWLLDAGQIDLARVRNNVGMSLWNDMTEKPYYADREPLARNGARSEWVEVFVNGDYFGIYAMGEPIDRKQLCLKKTETSDDVPHGQLWKTINWSEEVLMRKARYIDNASPEMWAGYETKYPDPADMPSLDNSALYEAVKLVANGSDAEFEEKVADAFDLPVLADYYIFVQLLNAVDNLGKNIYWAIYDNAQSPKLTLAPWDLDSTVGQYWNNESDDGQITPLRDPDNYLNIAMRLYTRLLALNSDGFADKLKQRYIDLRQGVLNADNLVGRYVECIEMLQRAGAAQREEQRWSGDSDINGLALDFEAQKNYIEEWLRSRLVHVDAVVFHLPQADVNGDGISDVTDVNLLIDMVLGRTAADLNAADIDGNGKVDVADVNKMINLILMINP